MISSHVCWIHFSLNFGWLRGTCPLPEPTYILTGRQFCVYVVLQCFFNNQGYLIQDLLVLKGHVPLSQSKFNEKWIQQIWLEIILVFVYKCYISRIWHYWVKGLHHLGAMMRETWPTQPLWPQNSVFGEVKVDFRYQHIPDPGQFLACGRSSP